MKVYYSTGRRKTASARVFLKPGTGKITINGKDPKVFLPYISKRSEALKPLYLTKEDKALDIYITVRGGGITGQSEAIRHGLARALTEYSSEHRPLLKKEGFLTRDSRMVERKKAGLHKARKSTQFTKR
ncbi:MAG: 30S ribosomal protein S9 [Oligoflexia bacterium]|nr:30S ribosomal protein S9 [Bdellovibrionales bacterium]MYE07348.1 30S ribosomal protein S9 [Oligoflexia bacterium]